MMKITLVHNAEAGYAQPSRINIIDILKKHDAEIQYISSEHEDLENLLFSEPADLIMVAGGDGTVHRIARLLLHQPIPLAILPVGTANNVAMSLNSESVSLSSDTWIKEALCQVDIGEVHFNGKSGIFFESLGLGTLASMMHQYSIIKKLKKPDFESRKEKLRYLYHFMLKILPTLTASNYHIKVDQKSYDGRYLWVEVINMQYFGPHLKLAPEADFGDGALDMVLIREEEAALLEQYFSALLAGEEAVPGFKVVRGKSFSITTDADPLHIDDVVLTKGKDIHSASQFHLSIHARQNALSFVKHPLDLP